MIPEGPLNKMVPLTEDHAGVHGDPRYLTDYDLIKHLFRCAGIYYSYAMFP